MNHFKVIFYHVALKEYYHGDVTDFVPHINCYKINFVHKGLPMIHHCNVSNAIHLDISDHPIVCNDVVPL